VLKLVSLFDIMYLVIRWDYMNNKVLISTAMLNAYWEKEKKDTLDLLIPFLKYSIAKTTNVGDTIDIQKVIEYLKTEFGYDTIPLKVILLILKRLSSSVLTKKRDEFILKISLDEEILRFEKGHTQYMERCSKVAKTLKSFLNDAMSTRKPFTEDQALQALMTFFATNGLCLIRDAAMLELIKKNDDALKYAIAQFVIKENSKHSEIFNYIEDMVKGFFVSTAISLQPQNPMVIQSKFKGLKCYIDTRIIIDALGMHLPEAKHSALEFLDMLKEKGAELCCFEHNYFEICDIISAYKYGLQNPSQNYHHLTLEGWDKQKYKVADVERYQALLENKISALGISVIPKPSITNIIKYPFNHDDLLACIKKHISYKKDEAIETDIASIASILLLRDGLKTREIEKTKAIFVTSNVLLVKVVNSFLCNEGVCNQEMETMPIITDIDLSSIVWLKCYATHKNYPTQRLIEHAINALEPTPTMLNAFFEMIDHIQAEGEISENEASILRTDTFCRKSLSYLAKGDATKITPKTVYDIKEKLREEYVGEADKKSELNYQKYLAEKEKKRDSILRALNTIKDGANKIYRRVYFPLIILSWIIRIVLIVSFVVVSIMTDYTNKEAVIPVLILLAFNIVGGLDTLSSKWKFVERFIKRIAQNASDRYSDKKKEEYKTILGTIEYDMPD